MDSSKTTVVRAICHAVQAAGASDTLLDPTARPRHGARKHRRDLVDAVSVIRHGDPARRPELDAPRSLLAAAPNVGPRWKRKFTLIARADAMLVAVVAIASDMHRVRELVRGRVPAEIAHGLESGYGRHRRERRRGGFLARPKLGALLGSETALRVFGAALDGRAAMDEGMSLLVDLGEHRLGEPVDRIIGETYLLNFWGALKLRGHSERPLSVIVDEAHLFTYGHCPSCWPEAPKFEVGVIIAIQHVGQLTGELGRRWSPTPARSPRCAPGRSPRAAPGRLEGLAGQRAGAHAEPNRGRHPHP